MQATRPANGSHVSQSPCASFLAWLSSGQLRTCRSHAPDHYVESVVGVPAKEIIAIRWSSDSSQIAVVSPQTIEVVNLDDDQRKIRFDNGSGGLGRFAQAEFVDPQKLLIVWEFGKAKIWDLATGRGADVESIKTACDGRRWEVRPDVTGSARLLTYLARPAADDVLILHFSSTDTSLAPVRLPTVDVRSLSWSPDGRWLAVLDSPRTSPDVHILTPDGHHFRSFPSLGSGISETAGLGVKQLAWSPDSQILALSKHDGRVELLHSKTFSPMALIEHSTTIDERSAGRKQRTEIWQEVISASSARSYMSVPQPVSPPLSRAKPSTEPSEVGVAEVHFSAAARYLATRDERMLNTVWIWDLHSLGAHTVIIQHSNVRKMHWHPTRNDLLMLDCGESIAYLFDAGSKNPPSCFQVSLPATATFSFLANDTLTVLACTRATFCLVYPYGREDESGDGVSLARQTNTVQEGEDDSLFEILSGRRSTMPQKDLSYTERIDMDVDAEDGTVRLDDTFQRKHLEQAQLEKDPLDDSDIF